MRISKLLACFLTAALVCQFNLANAMTGLQTDEDDKKKSGEKETGSGGENKKDKGVTTVNPNGNKKGGARSLDGFQEGDGKKKDKGGITSANPNGKKNGGARSLDGFEEGDGKKKGKGGVTAANPNGKNGGARSLDGFEEGDGKKKDKGGVTAANPNGKSGGARSLDGFKEGDGKKKGKGGVTAVNPNGKSGGARSLDGFEEGDGKKKDKGGVTAANPNGKSGGARSLDGFKEGDGKKMGKDGVTSVSPNGKSGGARSLDNFKEGDGKSGGNRGITSANPNGQSGGARSLGNFNEDEAGSGRPNNRGISGVGNRGNNQPKKPVAPANKGNWFEMANHSFQNDDESAAFQYLYGHVLAESSGKERQLAWVSGLLEPRLATRWAVGIQVSASKNFSGKPPLIGDVPVLPNNNRQRGSDGPAPGSSPYGNVDNKSVRGNLIYYTGELGERFLQAMDERRLGSDSNFGSVLGEFSADSIEISEIQGNNRRAGRNSDNASIGSVGTVNAGDAVPGQNRNRSNKNSGDFNAVSATGSLLPGVMHMGVGKSSNLIKKAKAEGIDFLVIFEVKIDQNVRTNVRNNSTKMKLVRIKDGKTLKSSATLDYIKVWRTRKTQKNESRDPVANEIKKFFAVVDSGKNAAISSEMPEFDGDVAKRRVEHIAGSQHSNPLPVVFEIVSYHRKGLISDAFAIANVAKLIGEDNANALFSSKESERKAALTQWMPEE